MTMLYSICRLQLVFIFKLIFRLKVFGKENIPKRGGFILASNHASFLDPLVLGVASPRKLNFMAKDDLFRNPIFSRLIFNVGAFPVKRHSADLSALKEAMRRIKIGRALALFPGGTRRAEGLADKAEPGIGFLAAKLNAPVIPAFVTGTDKALPKSARFIRPHKICVYFGKEIPIERRMPYQDIAQQIMENIRHLSCPEPG